MISTRQLPINQKWRQAYQDLLDNISAIDSREDKHAFALLTWYRLIFLRFLQSRKFLNAEYDYIQALWQQYQHNVSDDHDSNFYHDAILPLITNVILMPVSSRKKSDQNRFGNIPYLPLSIFETQPVEDKWPLCHIKDKGLQTTLAIFAQNHWELTDKFYGSQQGTITPTQFFQFIETYFGRYSTPLEIADHLCSQTISNILIRRLDQTVNLNKLQSPRNWILLGILSELNEAQTYGLLSRILPDTKVLDPACRTGILLFTSLQQILLVYQQTVFRLAQLGHTVQSADIGNRLSNLELAFKQQIIRHNLFGLDFDGEAVLATRMRLYLTLATSCQSNDDLLTLSVADVNIRQGNSLIGYVFPPDTQESIQPVLLAEKSHLPDQNTLNQSLLTEFHKLNIHYIRTVWNNKRNRPTLAEKRELNLEDIAKLQPFHWLLECF
jgi:hypothetical protein